MLQSIKNMLLALNTEGILYCHWKSNQHLEAALDGHTDLDILCKAEQRGQIEEILNRCGLKRFRATPQMQYNAIEDFLGFDRDTARIWHVHLHYRLTLGEKHLKGYTTSWADSVLHNRVYDDSLGIFCTSPEDELFLIILRIALKVRWRDCLRKFSQDNTVEIEWLKERTQTEQVVDTAKRYLGKKCAYEYEVLLDREHLENRGLFRLQKVLRISMSGFSSYNRWTSFIARTYREWSWLIDGISRRIDLQQNKPSRRISPSGGAVVAVIGIDGAGKSTTVRYVTKEFRKKIDVRNIYMGSGDGGSSVLRFPLRAIARRARSRKSSESVTGMWQQHDAKSGFNAIAYKIGRILWAVTLAIEKKHKLDDITKARNKGVLVIVDRYPQVEAMGINDGPLLWDYANSPSRLLKGLSRWEFSIYQSAYINPPDLTIKLVVPTRVALERKPGMSAAVIETKRAVVEKANLSRNSVTVDTIKDQQATFGEVMELIWKIV